MGKYDELILQRGKDGLKAGLDFIYNRFVEEEVDNDRISSVLMLSDECLVRLFYHARPGSECVLGIRKHFGGGISVSLEMPGDEFDISLLSDEAGDEYEQLKISLELDELGLEDVDVDMESSIRNVILRESEDRIKHKYEDGINYITIEA